MTDPDQQLLGQVRAAIRGNRPDTSRSDALYPVYVAVIAAGAYGIPAAQQLFRSLDGKWLADHALTPAGAVVAATAVALLLALVRFVGRVHGPVVPPLPYLELVVTSPMPRKVTLGRNWRLSLFGSVVGGLLVGAVSGAGLAIAHVAPPVLLLPATLGGGLLGVLVAELWLRGQLQASSLEFRPGPRSPADAETPWHCWTSPAFAGRPRATSPSAVQCWPATFAPSGSTRRDPPHTPDVFG